jgi:hypothetical protein
LQVARAVGGVADAQVGRAFLHRAHDLGAQVLFQVDLDAGMLARESAQVFRQKLHDGRDAGVHAHMAAHAVSVFAELALHFLEAEQHRTRMVQQAFAGRRQIDAARVAVQQRGVQRGFEVGEALADGRSRDEFALGRLADAAQLAHGHKELKRGQVNAAGKVAF